MKQLHKTTGQLIRDSMKKDVSQPLNWNNWSVKKTLVGNSWSKFFWWVLILLLAFAYANDTRECRALIEDPSELCIQYVTYESLEVNCNSDIILEVENESWRSFESGGS